MNKQQWGMSKSDRFLAATIGIYAVTLVELGLIACVVWACVHFWRKP